MQFGHNVHLASLSRHEQIMIASQKSRPIPLLDSSYYIPAADYYAYLVSGYLPFYPEILETLPPTWSAGISEKTYNVVLNTACFNFTQQSDTPQRLRELRQAIREFYQETGTLCSTFGAKREGNFRKDCKDVLLVCHPLLHRGHDLMLNEAKPEIKSAFFAFLWRKGFITEEQLNKNDAILWAAHRQISAEKQRLANL